MSAWYMMVRVLQLMQRHSIWILPFLQDQSVKNDSDCKFAINCIVLANLKRWWAIYFRRLYL
jgi:hypothetical protein